MLSTTNSSSTTNSRNNSPNASPRQDNPQDSTSTSNNNKDWGVFRWRQQQQPAVATSKTFPDDGIRDDDDDDKSKLRRNTVMYVRNRTTPVTATVGCFFLITAVLGFHRVLSLYMTKKTWVNAPITYIERTCPAPVYSTMLLPTAPTKTTTPQQATTTKTTTKSSTTPTICITTLTDHQSQSRFQRMMRWRNYDGVLDLTWKNKAEYAKKHGYRIFDGSHLIVSSRPPAWTKVIAMQHLLDDGCDWIMWMDADTVIMNSSIKIESFLPTAADGRDMIAAEDDISGYNSGVLLFRNTAWSKQFLQDWWDMKSYVRPPGFSLSGDNAALKALLRHMKDFDDHVLVPPRCTMNSFAVFLSTREASKLAGVVEEQSWYMSDRFYHKGDFIAHTPGYDNKATTLALLLQHAQ